MLVHVCFSAVCLMGVHPLSFHLKHNFIPAEVLILIHQGGERCLTIKLNFFFGFPSLKSALKAFILWYITLNCWNVWALTDKYKSKLYSMSSACNGYSNTDGGSICTGMFPDAQICIGIHSHRQNIRMAICTNGACGRAGAHKSETVVQSCKVYVCTGWLWLFKKMLL